MPEYASNSILRLIEPSMMYSFLTFGPIHMGIQFFLVYKEANKDRKIMLFHPKSGYHSRDIILALYTYFVMSVIVPR